MQRLKLFPVLVGLFCAFFGQASVSQVKSDNAILQFDRRFHPVQGQGGMVVSREKLASGVGADILAQGGNAIDAAVATGFALAVTFPQAGNLGGGGFMLVYLADKDKTIAVDYRETAPVAAHDELFLDAEGNVDRQRALFSHQSSGVPGTVAGLVQVQKKYGKLSLSQVIKPAIRLASQGFRVGNTLSYSLQRSKRWLAKNQASREYFFRENGSVLQPGDHWKQPDLAKTLKRIAQRGADGFYRGPVADLIVKEMERGNGLITHQDLQAYRVIEREAVVGTYRDYTVASMPPPSSGGVHLIQMLNILEGWDLVGLGHNSADYLHRLIESMRRAYADRSEYLGDPDFYDVPVGRLIDKDYAAQLRAGIDLTRASRSSDVRPGLELPRESTQTTHFSVWDKAGNVVSNTYTLNLPYGSGVSVAGAGFLLNNEMDDFSSKPGAANAYGLVGRKANAIEGGKRPLSSMTPTILFREGKPVLVTGSPGGSTIITAVLQTVLNVMAFDMNIAEATAAPRIHHQWLPDKVRWERGISADTLTLLKKMGHQIVAESQWVLGKTQSISNAGGSYFYGVSDYRWPDGAAVPVME